MKFDIRGMFGDMKRLFILFVYCGSVRCKETEIMKAFSESIGNAVMECTAEINFDEDIIQEFLSYWDPKHTLQGKHVGCAVMCVTAKLELLDNNGKIVVNNFHAFGKSIGSDQNTTNKLISLHGLCDSVVETKADECEAHLEVAKCFRYGIFQLNWAPDIPATEKIMTQ